VRRLFSIFFVFSILSLSASGNRLLTEIKDIRTYLWDPHASGKHFDITGDVAFVCGGIQTRIDVLDGNRFCTFWSHPDVVRSVKSGMSVRLCGTLEKSSDEILAETHACTSPFVQECRILATDFQRRFDEISSERLVSRDSHDRAIAVRGILSGVRPDELNPNWNWFALRTQTGKVFVATPEIENPLKALKALTDAEIIVKGFAAPSQRPSSFVGFYILPVGPAGVTCLVPPPTDPQSCPPLPEQFQNGRIIPAPQMPGILHRQRVRGQAIGQGGNRIFLLTDSGYFCSIAPEAPTGRIVPGTLVTAAGFCERSTIDLELTEAIVRFDDSVTNVLLRGATIKASDLFAAKEGKSPFDPMRQGSVVSLSGLVANSRESILHDGIIRLACGVHTVPVDISILMDALSEVSDACYQLTVTGVCFGSFTSGQSTSDLPVFTGFTIYPRVPEDIVIVSRPSWWTAGRLLAVILALVVMLVAILIWNRSLAVLSSRRGKRLYLEAIAHTKAELKVEERTHLAVELHDALSQTLTGVALQIDSASLANRGGNARVGQVLEVAKSMLSSCRRELHNCLWDLRSRTFEEKDMTEAVMRTLAPYSDGVEISVRFNVPRSLFEETQSHAILRMVRELAVNAINHGHATRLWIAGEHHDGTVSFSVRDNGCGFDPNAAPGPQQGHFGLQGVRERLEKLDGKMDIQSDPGRGTKISVRLRIQG